MKCWALRSFKSTLHLNHFRAFLDEKNIARFPHVRVSTIIISKEDENLYRWLNSIPSLIKKCCTNSSADEIVKRGNSDVTFSGPLLICALSTSDVRIGIMQDFQRHCYQLLRFNKMVSKYWLYTMSIKLRFIY